MAPLLSHEGAGTAGSYDPTSAVRYCNALPADFPSSVPFNDPDLAGNPSCTSPSPIAPNTTYDTTYEYNLPSGDYNFGSPVFTMTSSDHFVAGDAAIGDGTKVGGVVSVTTLGFFNNPCNNVLTAEFILYDSTTNTGNTIDPLPAGTANPFSNLVTDANNDNFGDSSSPFVIKYPSFYNSLFDPDLDYAGGPNGTQAPIQPLARYSGMTRVPAGTGDWVILSFFQFAPGALADFDSDPDNKVHPFGRISRTSVPGGTVGHNSYYVLLAVLNNPTGVVASPSPITDFCSPLAVKTMLLGSPGGTARAKTPLAGTGLNGAGTHLTPVYSFSQRDADGDGLENSLDTCPYNANTGADADSDGIDDACDTVNATGSDQDGDGFLNRQDNCPQVANGGLDQRDTENERTYISAAPDGGPKTDSMGDRCDADAIKADGDFIYDLNVIVACIGGTDADGDGWCAGGGDPNDGDAAVSGDADVDGDGFGDHIEKRNGTDPLENCSKTTSQVAWSPDFNNDTVVNIIDTGAMRPHFGSSPGDPNYDPRYDIADPVGINIVDTGALRPWFNKDCDIEFPSL